MATSYYNPRTGSWGAGYRYGNGYQGWGQGVVQRGNQWARGGYYYDDRGAIGGVRNSQGGGLLAAGNGDNRGAIARTSDGDLYAGKDGNIYKRDQSGNWSQRGDNGWNSVDTSKLSQEQQQRLNDARSKQPQSRQSGAQSSTNRPQPGTLGSGSASQSGRLQPGTLPSSRSNASSPGSGMAGSRAS